MLGSRETSRTKVSGCSYNQIIFWLESIQFDWESTYSGFQHIRDIGMLTYLQGTSRPKIEIDVHQCLCFSNNPNYCINAPFKLLLSIWLVCIHT